MTHFTVVVFTKTGQEDEVSQLLEPYNENGEFFADGSRWDWWTIGGRWDRAMLGSKPRTVKVTCDICNGTGRRPDGLERFGAEWVERMNGCNGCHGTGFREELAPEQAEGNVLPPAAIAPDFVPWAFVSPDGAWHESGRMGWFAVSESEDADWNAKWVEAKGAFANTLAVLVDAHV